MREPTDAPLDPSHSRPLIVDAHAYVGRPNPVTVGPGFDPSKWRGHSHQDLLRVMDAAGVDVALLHTNDVWANAYHQRVVRAHPDRLFSVCKIDEAAAHTSGRLEKLAAYAQRAEFRGLYFDAWPPDVDAFANFHAKKYGPFWRLVGELDLPICFVNYADRSPNLVSGLLKLLDRYPDFTITVVHGLYTAGSRPDGLLDDGGRVALSPELVRLVRDHDVYLEILTGYVDGDLGPRDEVLAALLETFGARKLIGTPNSPKPTRCRASSRVPKGAIGSSSLTSSDTVPICHPPTWRWCAAGMRDASTTWRNSDLLPDPRDSFGRVV